MLSFGYWTTNFAEVQRALSARNMSAARRTPIIAAYPKVVIPAVTVIPGLVAAGFSNIMNYIQALFALFNAPLFATFIIGMFWKRMTAWAGFFGLVTGTLGALVTYLLYKGGVVHFGSDLDESFWGAGIAFVLVAIVAVIVTLFTTPKPESELRGLVYGVGKTDLVGDAIAGDAAWYRSPLLLGGVAVALAAALYLPFL